MALSFMEDLELSNEDKTQFPDDAEATSPDSTPETVNQADGMNGQGDQDAPEIEIEEGTNLIAQLITAQKEAQANHESRLRTLAEFQNYKKRVEREVSESYQRASLDMLVKMLPIFDDFERGFSNLPDEIADHPWLNGITLIQRKFQKLLDEYDVIVLDPVGEVFDPSRHEAVGVEEDSDMPSGHITATLQKGYASGERILRPALVRVAG